PAAAGAAPHESRIVGRRRAGTKFTSRALFVAANRARARGEVFRAALLYVDLQNRFPGTHEEITSRVLLGRLLAERFADPEGALALYDGYLAAEPEGARAADARIGRALALRTLGRTRDEEQAWQELVARFPDGA